MQQYFAKLQKPLSDRLPPGELASDLSALKLPAIGASPKHDDSEKFTKDTYEAFAKQVVKMNPQFDFSKDTINQALRLASTRLERSM